MIGRKSRLARNVLSLGSALFLLFFPVLAQSETDPNPDSPTPVLISEAESTRALTELPAKTKPKRGGQWGTPKAFPLDSQIVIFVTNLDLLKDEGANAFRLYAEDYKGRLYRFSVLDLQPAPGFDGVYALTARLRDEIGYWQPPGEDGDVLVNVTWRGLKSNRVRVGIGKTGGLIVDDPGAVPTPLSAVTAGNFNLPGETPTSDAVGYRWSGDRIRFLEQATFGPTRALDDRVRRIGLRTWLAEQFDAPYPSAANPYPNIPLKPTTAPSDCDNNTTVPDVPATCFRDTYSMYQPQTWFFKEALYGDAQLRHRVAWALSQIWVISGVDTQQSSWMIAYHQQLSKNAFGNWRQLMQDVTLNPGMGNYLDMMRSTRNNPNENYPREILQLFNVGLFILNPDGTLKLDGEGNPIPTYDQNDINNFTKVFTGWRDCNVAASCPNLALGAPNYKDPMLLVNNNHDLTAKTLLSYPGSTTTNVAACAGCTGTAIATYANNSLNQALDNIYNHPNVAPFVSKMLIQHLVTSDPTPAYVARVAAVFNANRANASQMKEVVRAILLDPEARGNAKTDPTYGKLREPVLLMTNLFRQIGVTSNDGAGLSDGNVNRFPNALGQNVFNSPTVFNYYPPNYVVPGTSLLGPEFGIYNTGTAVGRANFANSMVFGSIAVSLPDTPNGTRLGFAELQALAAADTTSNQLLDALNQRLMHGAMSEPMRGAIRTAVNAVASTNPLSRAQTAVYLIVTSSQYQVQR
ncbi:MAG TPA: DUF1800 domain-containing protein [Pyrinomonadaceae bacterium]|jgi:uncharacterized protein (DUF1800 family)